MKLHIQAHLDYRFERPTDVLLQLEAASLPEQTVTSSSLLIPCENLARVPAQDSIGDRIWVCTEDRLLVDYEATVQINRILTDCAILTKVPLHKLPGETVQYLMGSRYCPSDRFESFVKATFGGDDGGPLILSMRDWVQSHVDYVPGSSNSETTAADTFISRRGICRDLAHLLITLARAAGIPARFASVYALGVDPPDFHAVAEVFIGGEWHLVDATGMAQEANMAKIGVGRDAADVSFLTSFGWARLENQSVSVKEAT